MKRLAVIPSDRIEDYLKQGMSPQWLKEYYNPQKFFDEVYLLSELEKDQDECLGMKVIHTPAKDFAGRIKDLKIDVVRAYGGNWACDVACQNKADGVPVIVSVHDKDPARLYDSVGKADLVWCVSDAVKSLVAKKFSAREKIWVLPNRVDMEVMRPRQPFEYHDLSSQYVFKHKVLFVGRLTPDKNLETLIKAIGILGENYCAVVVGSGDRAPYLELARGHRVDKRIFFVESVPHEDLSVYYSWADCMCTPSRQEGFGLVFIEALACRSFVVTSAVPPMTEYIKDEENGLLVPDFLGGHSIAQAIRRACEDKNLRERVRSNARASVDRFEKSRVAQQEAEYYQKVLAMKEKNEFAKFSIKDLFFKKR